MTVKALLIGAGLAFLSATAVQAAEGIEALDPPLPLAFPPGWAAFNTTSSEDYQPSGLPFDQALFIGYRELSEERRDAHDLRDGELFNLKAVAAAKRSPVFPEWPSDRDLSEEDRTTFHVALNRMRAFFERGAREVAPETAAKAQIKYECWMEAAEWDRQADADACQAAWQEAMNELSIAADYSLTDVVFEPYPSPQTAAVPLQPQSNSTAVTGSSSAGAQVMRR